MAEIEGPMIKTPDYTPTDYTPTDYTPTDYFTGKPLGETQPHRDVKGLRTYTNIIVIKLHSLILSDRQPC